MTDLPPQEPPGATQQGAGGEPTEAEMRAAMEEQLRNVSVQDLLLESLVGIVNLTARRILKEDERDLEQAKLGIDSIRAVVDFIAPEPAEGVRRALSELQMHYVRAAGGAGEEGAEGAVSPNESASSPGGPGAQAPPQRRPAPPPGPGAEPPPRLWTPGRGN